MASTTRTSSARPTSTGPAEPHPSHQAAATTAALLAEVLALTPELYGRTVVGHLAAALETLAEGVEPLTAEDVLRAVWRAAAAGHKLAADLAARRASTQMPARRT